MKTVVLTTFLLGFSLMCVAQDATMNEVARIKKDVKSVRVGSYDRTGGNNDRVENVAPGQKLTLMDVKGAGIINHIWITIAPGAEKLNRNDIILRMYWDGNTFPSVEAPIGAFFGNGWGEAYNFVSAPLTVSPGWGKSYVSYFAMPFASGARIEIENQNDSKIEAFYYNIDYVKMPKLAADYGRFHAWYNRQITKGTPDGENEWAVMGEQGKNPTGKDNYLIADIKGKGQYIGVNYYVNSPGPMWYGEGDEMVFIDGDTIPTIVGTGTEDYFNTSWSPKELFQHPYFGYPRVNGETGWLGRTHVYRFHIQDPIYFDKSIKFTIEHGHNNCLTLDLATVAYWYQSEAAPVPAIADKQNRIPMPVTDVVTMHKWRNEWLKQNSNQKGSWGK